MHRGRDWTARGLALVAIAVGIGGGTAFAATKHYLITSTKQIKPSVLKSLKKAGPRGAKGATGSQGAQGNAGANGTNGTNGTNGVNGAVAGYSGTGQVSMGTQMQLTVLTKTLPAGSYVISGSVAVQAQRPGATPSSTGASVQCGLTLSGSGTVNETFTSPWDAQVDETADGTISFATAGKLTSPGTVTISCTNYSGPGGAQDNGTYASIGLIGYVTAVQTTSNS
jgi:hypothetical protein